MDRRWLLAWALRLVGSVELLALGAVVMPHAWMEAVHAWLGVGDMPQGPVFDSVMRHVSFIYGLHGVALWLIATDVVRYRPLVWLTALGCLLAGPVFILIDLALGMPWFWVADSGGTSLLLGTVLLVLLRSDRSTRPPVQEPAHASASDR
jgi:hypothetical protein